MSTYENKLAADFLLGRLDDNERAAFEEIFVTDKGVYQELLQAENDLVDEFVRGDMAAEDRERFEANFLKSERQRQKVLFSRALMAHSSVGAIRTAAAVRSPAVGLREWISSLLSIQPAFAMAAAAILVFLVGGIILFTRASPAEYQARIQPAEPVLNVPTDPSTAPTDTRTETVEPSKDLPQQKVTPRVQPTKRETPAVPETGKAAAKAPSTLAVISTIMLTPGMTRGSNQETFTAGYKKTGSIRLQMEAPADAGEFQRYAVIVETVAGDQVWNRKLRKTSGSLTTLVPHRVLQRGDYIVTLKGIAANGSADTLNEYTFSIR